MKRMLAILVVVGIASVAMAAPAVTYGLSYVQSYDNDTNWGVVGDKSAFFGATNMPGYDAAWVHEMQVHVSLSGVAADEDMNQMGIGLTLDPGLSDTIGWSGSTEQYTYDPPGPPPAQTKNIFSSNSDGGTSSTDLRAIVASISAEAAWVTQYAEAGSANTLVGTVYLKWDGAQISQLTAFGDPPTGSTWVTWTGNSTGGSTTIQAQPQGTSTDGVFVFGPEPVSMTLLAIGGALLRRRR